MPLEGLPETKDTAKLYSESNPLCSTMAMDKV
jgi:hypothetical protein